MPELPFGTFQYAPPSGVLYQLLVGTEVDVVAADSCSEKAGALCGGCHASVFGRSQSYYRGITVAVSEGFSLVLSFIFTLKIDIFKLQMTVFRVQMCICCVKIGLIMGMANILRGKSSFRKACLWFLS